MGMKKMGNRNRILIAASLALVVMCGTVNAQENPLRGKTLNMIIGFAPGGTTDVFGRFLSVFLTKHLPGNPPVVVQNMPGADGMSALNAFVRQVKPDGMTFVVGSATQVDPVFYRASNTFFDVSKFQYAGAATSSGTVVVINKKAMARLTDPHAPPVVIGALAAVRSGMQILLWAHEYLHWNTRIVMGYQSTQAMKLAILRGEIDMVSMADVRDIKEILDTGEFSLLTQAGYMKDGRSERRPQFDTPVFTELLADKIDAPDALSALAYTRNLMQVGQWMALPPGSPPDLLPMYRAAFHAAYNDVEFQEKVAQVFPGIVEFSGDEMQRVAQVLSDTPPAAIDYMNALMKKASEAR
jgi:tripartite-type tricarboxylate transporter receptor subunit TctC